MTVFERDSRAYGHAVERILRNVERDVDLVRQPLVQATEQGAAACEIDAVVHNVGIEFWRRLLQGGHDGRLNLRHAPFQRVGNLLVRHRHL